MMKAPTYVLALARQPHTAKVRLKSVLLTTDHVPRVIKRVVEERFACTVYNHCGMTGMGLGAVPYAPCFDLRVSTLAGILAGMNKRTIIDRRNHA